MSFDGQKKKPSNVRILKKKIHNKQTTTTKK
jgi:hypothetical protein